MCSLQGTRVHNLHFFFFVLFTEIQAKFTKVQMKRTRMLRVPPSGSENVFRLSPYFFNSAFFIKYTFWARVSVCMCD